MRQKENPVRSNRVNCAVPACMLRYRPRSHSSRKYRCRNSLNRGQHGRLEKRQHDHRGQNHSLQCKRRQRAPSSSRTLGPGNFQHAIGEHGVLHCEISLQVWTPPHALRHALAQIKKAAFSRGLLELSRDPRCRPYCFGVSVLGVAGLVAGAVAPGLATPGLAAPELAAGAGTPDCWL